MESNYKTLVIYILLWIKLTSRYNYYYVLVLYKNFITYNSCLVWNWVTMVLLDHCVMPSYYVKQKKWKKKHFLLLFHSVV
jgi:hypothetical protein